MFEYIRLKNFKAFGDVEFNLLDKKGDPKKLILIYGENGIGKSNLASAFFMLSETLRTMNVRDIMQSILSEKPEGLNNEEFTRFLKFRYKDIETLIKENKTVDSDKNMYLEFGFRLKDNSGNYKSGKYILETNDTQIVYEHLEFTLSKNRGAYFDITPTTMTINAKIFLEKTSYQEIKLACKKYWGKHSLLSIIMYESQDKAEDYIKNQLTDNLKRILAFLSRTSCRIKGSRHEYSLIGLPPEVFGNFDHGEISLDDESLLAKTEIMLNKFFKLTYRDIEKVYYKRLKKEDSIEYQLMLIKKIAGQFRKIDFSLESTGTQATIELLPFMLVVTKGSTAIIDEFDLGIHDLLVESLVTSLYDGIAGQLILTTHNTLLMETDEIPKECIYVINELETGNKEIQCITYYDNKIHKNTDIRGQYIQGRYKGIPEKTHIDFSSLLKILESN